LNSAKCKDKNPKILKRIFEIFNKKLEISLCQTHSKDPDFSNFISETPITQESLEVPKN
jgi:hypothetical protein